MPYSPVADAVARITRGEMVVVVDDSDRENEGDLIFAGEHATPERIAFMVRHTSGVVCVALPERRCDALGLPLMVPVGRDAHGTAFTVTVDARQGTTTGISAADRATTIRALAHDSSRPEDFVRPGHVFPLRARDGGVLARRGHTEAASDLARLAGCAPVGVLAELVNDDGTMMRLPGLEAFRRAHGLALIHIEDLVAHRRRTEPVLEPLGRSLTAAGEATTKQHLHGLAQGRA